MKKILTDPAWVRFITMMIGIVIAFTITVASKNKDVEHLQAGRAEDKVAIKEIRISQSKDHDELIRQGTVLEEVRSDGKETSRDVKRILQAVGN